MDDGESFDRLKLPVSESESDLAIQSVRHKPPCGTRRIGPSDSRESINSHNSSTTVRKATARETVIRRSSATSLSTTSGSVADELLEASFTEWCDKKEREINSQRRSLKEEQIKKEDQQALKKSANKERSLQVVDKWSQAKEKVLKEKLIIENEQKKQEKEERDKLLEKEQCSTEAAQRWRVDKTSRLKEQYKEKERKSKKSDDDKQEETKYQMESAAQAFKVWRERKDKQQKGSLVKMGKENKDKTRTTLIQKQERQLLATSSYHIWKSTKDKKIHETKTLFTYKLDPRQPPKDNKWRPARSIKYSYPTDPKTESRRSGSNVTSSGLVKPVDSYSSHSFESDAESQPTSPSSSHEDNLKKTGQLKTVTLCCQTLEYWCTCEDNKKNEE